MSTSKFEYSQAIGRFAPRMKKIADEYEKATERPLKDAKDIEFLKIDWLKCVKKFRALQLELEQLEPPSGFEGDGHKMVQYFTEYIDSIENKSRKFGVDSMKSGELDELKEKELQASRNLNEFTYKLTKKMFG